MPGNAPEELRERVNELEATVRGLTQELVEANERIRHLEEEAEADAGPEANRPIPAEDGETDERDEATEAEDAEEAEETEDAEDAEDDDGVEDDIIVA